MSSSAGDEPGVECLKATHLEEVALDCQGIVLDWAGTEIVVHHDSPARF